MQMEKVYVVRFPQTVLVFTLPDKEISDDEFSKAVQKVMDEGTATTEPAYVEDIVTAGLVEQGFVEIQPEGFAVHDIYDEE